MITKRYLFQDDLPNSFLCGSNFNNDSKIAMYMRCDGLTEEQALRKAGELDFKLIYEKDWGGYDDDE